MTELRPVGTRFKTTSRDEVSNDSREKTVEWEVVGHVWVTSINGQPIRGELLKFIAMEYREAE